MDNVPSPPQGGTQEAAYFLAVELDLAITFCEMAKTMTYSRKIERNFVNARNVCRTAQKYIERMKEADLQYPDILDERLGRLRLLLGTRL